MLPARPQTGGGGGGGRRFSSDKPAGGSKPAGRTAPAGAASQPTALQRVRQASAAGSGAFKALTQTAGNTSTAIYKQLPDKVLGGSDMWNESFAMRPGVESLQLSRPPSSEARVNSGYSQSGYVQR